ncbi:MAG: universal stress protein, partial [Arthrobacter sp.]|nr:universal stress protein [Arthrobacter sp.]
MDERRNALRRRRFLKRPAQTAIVGHKPAWVVGELQGPSPQAAHSDEEARVVSTDTPETAPQGIHGGVIVGVDGSEHGQCALSWAAREAERRRTTLHLITAYSVPIYAASGLDGGYAAVDDSVIRQGAESVLKDALERIKDYDIDVDASVENGDASGVLLELGREADLLVVGSRGRGGFVGRLLGSVSSALPAHASCPTVVVPMICAGRFGQDVTDKHLKAELAKNPLEPVKPRVVVGADGSDQARVAVLGIGSILSNDSSYYD